jgi:hypothetical protein
MKLLTKNAQKPESGLQVQNIAVRHKAVDDVILRECIPHGGGSPVDDGQYGPRDQSSDNPSRAYG